MSLTKLTKKQIAALDELYSNGGDELAVQQKFNIKYSVWQQWLDDYYFAVEIDRRLQQLQRQADIMLAKFKPMALAMLMSLCQSSSEEVSRKACVELLYLKFSSPTMAGGMPEPPTRCENMSDETASKILELIAEEKRRQREF
jgi:hypothetical protein